MYYFLYIYTVSKGLFDINSAIDGLEENLGDSLQNQDLGLHSIIPECMDQYKDGLQKCRENKLKSGIISIYGSPKELYKSSSFF